MLYALFRTLHFIAILALTAALIIENMALKPTINGEDARNLAKVDAVYGVAAALTLLFGLSLWLWIGKPAEFYSQNPIFQLKLGLFFLLALLSIYPAIFFIRNRKSTATTIAVPRLIGVLTKLELVVLVITPLLAFLMARGIGLNT
jgi:putative membrane protein